MNIRTYLMGQSTQIIEVDTEKMQHRGINKGDTVVVDITKEPAPGDIGVSGAIGEGEIREVQDRKEKWRGKVVMVVKEV